MNKPAVSLISLIISLSVLALFNNEIIYAKKKPPFIKQKKAAPEQVVAPSGVWKLCSKSVPHRADYDLCSTCDFKANNTAIVTSDYSGDMPTRSIYWKMEGNTLLLYFIVDENIQPAGPAKTFIWNNTEKCFYSQPEPYGPEGTLMSVYKLKK